jgi:hypothetical protein
MTAPALLATPDLMTISTWRSWIRPRRPFINLLDYQKMKKRDKEAMVQGLL